ncbi:UTP--glucose-1-phosphate uridylyltransferase GalU [Candidatus Arthromitus sp. SFB-turkey]|uniref:UTP--glucose-1-phosphate uridylyltransferase GalU n=1 Tax=Candidatus Arthromitus sp. SFB-turkey TaxID=1840217 RepID=UPI0007F4CF73|nr:UTP--glucose-1-phosphate uridylyltransferase GalU [Candidatus Arthromitus sp. SFB-turkey]OAT89292.1 UTP--glucose-1-phosphate uridylyltransferase [Candidatus Arthromitus sp. SFB-turkey]HJD00540.1 UTP--glucose-1-phosphate uridylyltransferase GalU [Candidatus Dwaynia gallinarum]
MSVIRKAIIPVAGFGTRFLPVTKSIPKEMIPIIDKPTIQYIIEEAVESGITDILLVTSKYKKSIEDYFDNFKELESVLESSKNYEMLDMIKNISNMVNITFVRQKEQKGLGHAIYQGKTFVGNEPFCVLLGDDIVYNRDKPCLKQLIECYEEYGGSVLGVQEVKHEDVSKYGIVDGNKISENIYRVNNLIEKPSMEEAPTNIAILGRYVISCKIFEHLEKENYGKNGEIQLTDSITNLISTEEVYAYKFQGTRYDIGDKVGYLKATIDYSLRDDKIKHIIKDYLGEKLK